MLLTKPDIDRLFSNILSIHLSEEEWQHLELLREHPDELSTKELIQVLIILTRRRDFLGDMAYEERNISDLQKLLVSFSTVEFESWLDLFRARLFSKQDKAEEAILLFRKILSAKGDNLESIKLFTHLFLAYIYVDYGANDQAIETFEICIKLAKQMAIPVIQSMALSNLAYIYLTDGRLPEALELCRESIRISRTDRETAGSLLSRIRECTILLEMGEYDTVEKKILVLQKESNQSKGTTDPSVIELILGKVFRKKGDYVQARSHFETALKINRERVRPLLITNSLLHLVEMLVEMGKFEEAEDYLQEAKRVCEKLGSTYQTVSCLEVTVTLRSAEHRYQEALEAFREYHEVKRKMLSQESDRRMQLVRVEHQVEQKEREAEIYRVKSEQLEKELMNKTTYLISQSELLARFKDDLKKIVTETSDPASGIKRVREKIKDIQTETINWEEYDKTFSAVHPEFKQNLLEQFPDLTPMETKVCTLLRIELSTKEIAQLLNISERSVENHRYRARKKVELGDHENFQQFLASL